MMSKLSALLAVLVAIAVLFGATPSTAASWRCPTVKQGRHSPITLTLKGLSSKSTLTYWFKFDKYTEYNIQADCQGDFNKLWGKSRCGYFNSHHKDSDRFVWRPFAGKPGKIQLAAYAYDDGKKPYQNIGTLMKILNTPITPGVQYGSKIEFQKSQTIYTLFDSNGNKLEQVSITHNNKCKRYNRGYLLGLYFGGNCKSPSDISVCFRKGDSSGAYAIKAQQGTSSNQEGFNGAEVAVFAGIGVLAVVGVIVGAIVWSKRPKSSSNLSDPTLLDHEMRADTGAVVTRA